MKIILASASPRRRELLEMAGYGPLEIRRSAAEEPPMPGESPRDHALRGALAKGRDIFSSLSPEEKKDALVIAADTVVDLAGEIFSKPSSPEDARRMLTCLSGKSHFVHTALWLCRDGKERQDIVTTRVTFRPLIPEEIDRYIATGEPMDKAGAYGIQGKAAPFISSLEGDYYTVVGFPLCRFSEMFREMQQEGGKL